MAEVGRDEGSRVFFMLWNDWRSDAGITSLGALLLLGGAAPFTAPMPQSNCIGDVTYDRRVPLFVTAKEPMRHPDRAEEMKKGARPFFIPLKRSIPPEICRHILPCSRCVARFLRQHARPLSPAGLQAVERCPEGVAAGAGSTVVASVWDAGWPGCSIRFRPSVCAGLLQQLPCPFVIGFLYDG